MHVGPHPPRAVCGWRLRKKEGRWWLGLGQTRLGRTVQQRGWTGCRGLPPVHSHLSFHAHKQGAQTPKGEASTPRAFSSVVMLRCHRNLNRGVSPRTAAMTRRTRGARVSDSPLLSREGSRAAAGAMLPVCRSLTHLDWAWMTPGPPLPGSLALPEPQGPSFGGLGPPRRAQGLRTRGGKPPAQRSRRSFHLSLFHKSILDQ